jgi:hypothetical protein
MVAMDKMTKPKLETINAHYQALEKELQRLQRRTSIGYEVKVKWLPSVVRHHNGKQLAEEIIGDTILIYTEDPQQAIELVRHGFAEWILNQYTKPYRQLINKLITLFEEQQYEKKERAVAALTKLLV